MIFDITYLSNCKRPVQQIGSSCSNKYSGARRSGMRRTIYGDARINKVSVALHEAFPRIIDFLVLSKRRN
jgi:hypothetical protein